MVEKTIKENRETEQKADDIIAEAKSQSEKLLENAKKEAEKGRPKPLGSWFRFMTAYVFCGLTIAVFILGIIFGGIG